MKGDNIQNIIKLAKRYNNNKRKYLLVNIIQAKHIPTSPRCFFAMIKDLSLHVKKYSGRNLVLGFAETATAIAYELARQLGEDTFFVTTTREVFDTTNYVYFSEEHSHATEQRLYVNRIKEIIDKIENIFIVDDEITTGKTVVNLLRILKSENVTLDNKKIILTSIVNRVSDDNLQVLASNNVMCESLYKLDYTDYSNFVEDINVVGPCYVEQFSSNSCAINTVNITAFDPRFGEFVRNYKYGMACLLELVQRTVPIDVNKRYLFLGTEECMYPAIFIGVFYEDNNCYVKCHSTTRSPIGINNDSSYPINEGYSLESFYEKERVTFIYDLDRYDEVVVITDTKKINQKAVAQISSVLQSKGCNSINIFRIEYNV